MSEIQKYIDVRADFISDLDLRALIYRCQPTIEIANLIKKVGEPVLKRALVVFLTTTTGNTIEIIADVLAYLGETDASELNKYMVLINYLADISTDCQGSDTIRFSLGGGWRPSWYGPGVFGDNEQAGPYTQFSGGLWVMMSEETDFFDFDFAQWAAAETHSGVLRAEFWKTEVATDKLVKST